MSTAAWQASSVSSATTTPLPAARPLALTTSAGNSALNAQIHDHLNTLHSLNTCTTMAALIIKYLIDPINPSEMLRIHNQIQICSDASEKNLTSGQIFISHAHGVCDVSILIANSKWPIIGTDWGIMGYNDQRNSVCHRDKSDKSVRFHRTGSISSDRIFDYERSH